MRAVLIVLILCLGVRGIHASAPRISANINDYVDKFLINLRPWLLEHSLDPFKIDDISREFWFKLLFVNYTASMDLYNGQLHGISTLVRSGDAILTYERQLLLLQLTLKADELTADFDYAAKVLGVGPKGDLTATFTQQFIQILLLIDLDLLTLNLDQFVFENRGKVDVQVTGLGLVGLADAAVNAILDGITLLFKNVIVGMIGDQIDAKLQQMLEDLGPLLPPLPTTAIPTSTAAPVSLDL